MKCLYDGEKYLSVKTLMIMSLRWGQPALRNLLVYTYYQPTCKEAHQILEICQVFIFLVN